MGLDGKARDWWNSIPCNFTGNEQGLASFLTLFRRAFPSISADRDANRKLSLLKLDLVEGAWTPFRSQFARYVVQLNIPDSYAITILSDKVPISINVYWHPFQYTSLALALDDLETIVIAMTESSNRRVAQAPVTSTPAIGKVPNQRPKQRVSFSDTPSSKRCDLHGICGHETKDCRALRRQSSSADSFKPNSSQPAS